MLTNYQWRRRGELGPWLNRAHAPILDVRLPVRQRVRSTPNASLTLHLPVPQFCPLTLHPGGLAVWHDAPTNTKSR
jgi:hypothetical protein